MITIASLFDRKSTKKTGKVWDLLESECEMIGIKSIPYPHFSWLTGADFVDDQISLSLSEISQQMNVFEIKTAGLGVFTGESPIIYLPIIKTQQLLTYHQMIWNSFSNKVKEINSYYAPQNWVPHITIGYGDVTLDTLSCALKSLLHRDLSLNIIIDNVSYLSRVEEDARVERIAKLKVVPAQ